MEGSVVDHDPFQELIVVDETVVTDVVAFRLLCCVANFFITKVGGLYFGFTKNEETRNNNLPVIFLHVCRRASS